MHCSGIITAVASACVLACGVSCSSLKDANDEVSAAQSFTIGGGNDSLEIAPCGKTRVRTTAYTHTEADSLKYGNKNACGTALRYHSVVRSAAADWSRFPVGTLFKVEGEPQIYHIDDYGSALVGTNTIDIYKPDLASMNKWGVRHLDIQVLKWGSWEKSADILDDRTRYKHVRKMLSGIEEHLSVSNEDQTGNSPG